MMVEGAWVVGSGPSPPLDQILGRERTWSQAVRESLCQSHSPQGGLEPPVATLVASLPRGPCLVPAFADPRLRSVKGLQL